MYIKIKKTKFIDDQENVLIERPGSVDTYAFKILGYSYSGKSKCDDNGTQYHIYVKGIAQ